VGAPRARDAAVIGRAAAALATLAVCGCAANLAGSLQEERLRFNEAVKATAEEQMLLNIVRLRYGETPSNLSITSIAMQTETSRSLGVVPFFGAVAGAGPGEFRRYAGVLPQGQLAIAERPTITLTPLDDQEFTRRLFTPMSADGVLYLAKTTWPIATVFRLWLENLNWVSNAQSASGPTPARAPDYEDFQRGVMALQALQDRAQLVFSAEEREEQVGGELAAERVTGRDVALAAKDGFEYKPTAGGKTWVLTRKKRQPVMRVHPDAVSSPEMREATQIFRLRRESTRYDIEIEKLDPFAVAPRGVEIVDLETRSLLQVLYYVSKGVEVPAEHLHEGLAVTTRNADGSVFDWGRVTRGLLRVRAARAEKAPALAHVAVRYLDHWFYLDRRDADSMSTFSLLVGVSRLELPARTQGAGPALTLPLGGR
jgi:hypothetical protein